VVSNYYNDIALYTSYIIVSLCYSAVLVTLWRFIDFLPALHFDFWSLVTLVISGTILQFQTGIEYEMIFQAIIWIASLGILFLLIKNYKKIPRTNFYWIPFALFGSLAISLIIAMIESTQPQIWLAGSGYGTKDTFLVFLRSFLFHLSSKSIAEEFIFRGFLWFCLYSLGWSDNRVF
jgi:hypothetical protein